jgi:5-methyltetrahydropteroyltriglutamate--homocysteine methyltransferase
MQRSTTRIRTSHVGRLPPPKAWEDMPARLAAAEIADPATIAAEVTPAVAETVRKQAEIGIDCIGDGEFWTARSLAHYTAHFTGIEARPVAPGEPPTTRHSTRERDEFPDFYTDMDRAGTLFLVPGEKPMPPVTVRVVARGPLRSKGREVINRQLDTFKAAIARSGADVEEAFVRAGAWLARPFHLQLNTTRPRKNFCSPSPTPCARNTGPWWMPGLCCRSTTRACRTGGTC